MLKRTINTTKKPMKFARRSVIMKKFSHNTIAQKLINAVEDGDIDAIDALDACMAEMFDEDIQRVFEELCGDSCLMSRHKVLSRKSLLARKALARKVACSRRRAIPHRR